MLHRLACWDLPVCVLLLRCLSPHLPGYFRISPILTPHLLQARALLRRGPVSGRLGRSYDVHAKTGASASALVPSLAAQILGAGRKFTETEILAAFAAAEDIPFPLADLEKLVPEICKHCSAVADSLSVPLSWVLLAELCTAAFLAPTSVLLPTKTLPLHSMPWALILHPGATQTSGLMAAYNRTLRQIELWEDEFQLAQAKLAFRQQQDGAQPAAAGGDEQVTKRPRFTPPPPMHMGFTSGSIDGVVGRMAEPQNLSRAAAFLAEGLIFLSWISDQCASHKGLITQLTDRILWDKVTVKACFSNVCFLF